MMRCCEEVNSSVLPLGRTTSPRGPTSSTTTHHSVAENTESIDSTEMDFGDPRANE
jgi:hypothetical protein